jgi:hypothetical protein
MTESDFVKKLTFIQKLRRFSLAIGLILIAYSLAGVQLKTPAEISPLGIPLIIRRPVLLDIALLIASIYEALRYYYYAILITPSPQKRRDNLKKGLSADGLMDESRHSNEIVKMLDAGFNTEFPTMGEYKARIRSYNRLESPQVAYDIPKQVEILCILENIDYYSPIWVNFLSILLYISLKIYALISTLQN